jgi:uncharacterized protein (DUF58 family)
MGRAFWFTCAAFSFYLFGNQTQIGWLYVVSALLLGIVAGAWWLNRGALRGISLERQIESREAYHEDEALSLTLRLDNRRRLPAPQVQVHDPCPVVAPDAPEANLRLLFPFLPTGISDYEMTVTLNRRGVFQWDDIRLSSGAPFGFFQQRRRLPAQAALIVYPVVRPLDRFNLLDKQSAAQWTTAQAGWGSEILGVRDYQRGDSLRHIHWRSVARRGQLITKEFADEAHPALTLVLDRYQAPSIAAPQHKHTPFEWQIKCAVSIAEYAFRRHYPSYLLAEDGDSPLPHGALAWESFLQISARLQTSRDDALGDVLAHASFQGVVVVVTAFLSARALEPLIGLHRRGFRLLVVHCRPETFPDMPAEAGQESEGVLAALMSAGIAVQSIPYGSDWAQVLSEGTDHD